MNMYPLFIHNGIPTLLNKPCTKRIIFLYKIFILFWICEYLFENLENSDIIIASFYSNYLIMNVVYYIFC